MFHVQKSSLSSERNHQKHILVSQCLVDPPLGGRVDTIVEIKGINARWPHTNGTQAKWLRGRQKFNYTPCCKTKGMHEYKHGQGRPKWKLPKGSKAKTQTHAIGGGEEIEGETKKPKASLIGRAWKAWQCFWWCAMPCYKNNDPQLEQRMLR